MLELIRVGKSLGGRALFDSASLSLRSGEFVAVMGESGTGKSTLLNLVAGLEPADHGSIHLDGVELTRLGDDALSLMRRQKLGFVFQAFHVLPHLSVLDNVALPMRLNGARLQLARQAAAEMLAEVGLRERAADAPGQLSGGELQRVAIARALVHRPSLVLADEPTGNLDPDNAGRVLALFAEQVRRHHTKCLMVTHSERAAAIADRVIILQGGALWERPATSPECA